ADAVNSGLVRGWPRGTPARLSADQEQALAVLLTKLSTASRSSLVSLANRWGSKALEKYAGEVAASLVAAVRDESKGDAARAEAARRLVEFRPADPGAVAALPEQVTPRTAPALASGVVAAVSRSTAPGVGERLLDALPRLTPAVRSEAIRALIGREDWAKVLLAGVGSKLRLDDLSLDQR